jgi:D-threo-aldose 1-dehydrogenase
MRRYGMVIGIRPESIDEYRRLHKAVWPKVIEQIERSNISNYTIYLREPENLLFSHFEYHGKNFEADMAAMARDPETQRWWTLTSPCQAPLDSRVVGEHWALMQEVFHFDGTPEASWRTRLPRVGFGAAAVGNLYRPMADEQARDAVLGALEVGITYFDTAPHYGFGLSERRLGAVLAEADPTGSCLVSTKVGRLLKPLRSNAPAERYGFVDADAFEPHFDYTYEGVMRSFEQSLRRLRRDRIDILLAHDLGRATHGAAHDAYFKQFIDSGYRAMRELREQGVIGAVGLGVNEWEICIETLRLVDLDVILLAGRYTLLDQSALDLFLPMCAQRDIPVILGGPYNSGILAGGSQGAPKFDYRPASEPVIAQVRRIEDVCHRFDVALPSAALQFPLAHPQIAAVIPGIGSRAEALAARNHLNQPIPKAFWQALRNTCLLRGNAPLPMQDHERGV